MVETGVGTTTYGYDTAGRMTSLQNPFSETTSFQYDAAGRLTKRTLHSGAYTDIGYCCCLPTSVVHKKSDNSVISSESYVYSNAGNMTSKIVDGVTTTYTYDNADQLLSESRTGYSASYTYDANGNRATRVLNGVTETYSNDSGDKLTSVTWSGGSKTYGYDAAGRTTSVVTSAGTTTLAYDYEGRITTITYPGGATNTFQYNGLGTRVQRVDAGGTKNFKRDGVDVISPVINDSAANYTPGISERRSSTTTYNHSSQKNFDLQTTSSQSTSATRTYDAFGNITNSTGTWSGLFGYGGPFGYQGDGDSGFMLLGHRYYDPSIGKFVTRDPFQDGRNWHVYALSNPVQHCDPMGGPVWFAVIGALLLVYDIVDTGVAIVNDPTDVGNYLGVIDPTPGNSASKGVRWSRRLIKGRRPRFKSGPPDYRNCTQFKTVCYRSYPGPPWRRHEWDELCHQCYRKCKLHGLQAIHWPECAFWNFVLE